MENRNNKKYKTDVLRSIGKQSGKSVESVLRIYRWCLELNRVKHVYKGNVRPKGDVEQFSFLVTFLLYCLGRRADYCHECACLSVCLSVSASVCLSASISRELHFRSSQMFVNITYGVGSSSSRGAAIRYVLPVYGWHFVRRNSRILKVTQLELYWFDTAAYSQNDPPEPSIEPEAKSGARFTKYFTIYRKIILSLS